MSDEAWCGFVCAAIKRGDIAEAAVLMRIWADAKEKAA